MVWQNLIFAASMVAHHTRPPTLRPPRVKICSTAVNTSVTEIEKYLKFEKYLKIHYNIEKFACDFPIRKNSYANETNEKTILSINDVILCNIEMLL